VLRSKCDADLYVALTGGGGGGPPGGVKWVQLSIVNGDREQPLAPGALAAMELLKDPEVGGAAWGPG
jgi:hypothetical protein